MTEENRKNPLASIAMRIADVIGPLLLAFGLSARFQPNSILVRLVPALADNDISLALIVVAALIILFSYICFFNSR